MSFFGITNLDKNFWIQSAGFGTMESKKRRRDWSNAMNYGVHMGIPAAVSFLRRVVIRHTKDQKYALNKLTLLDLPKKHMSTLVVPFKTKAEETMYQKLETYFAAQYVNPLISSCYF